TLNLIRRIEVVLKTYSDRSLDNAREAQEDLFSVQNGRKKWLGALGGLQDPEGMAKKRKAEADLREAVLRDSKLKDFASAWDEVEATLRYMREIRNDYNLWERGQAFRCDLFAKARTLLRAAEELSKPEGERLREYRSSGLDSLKFALLSDAPI